MLSPVLAAAYGMHRRISLHAFIALAALESLFFRIIACNFDKSQGKIGFFIDYCMQF